MANGSQQIAIFYVFLGFFVLIGIASLAALLGFVPSADKGFRKWAVPGFVGAVAVAVIGVYKALTLSPFVPIVVTLLPPTGAAAPSLKSGSFQYDEVAQDTGKVSTHRGNVVPVVGEANWQVHLPGEVSNKAIQLLLEDEDGNWWRTGRFYANYVKQELRAGTKPNVVGAATWQVPGVAVVAAAGGDSLAAGQEQAAIKFNNYARRNGTELQKRAYYDWRVFVDDRPAVLDTIAQVDYVLHPTFSEPFQSSRDRSKQFEVKGSGWGGFTIVITVHYANGKEAKTSYFLDLNKPWPAAPPSTPGPNAVKEVGRWRLDRSRSTMGIYSEIVEELREIQTNGSSRSVSWRRVLSNKKIQQGSYQIVCDGAEHVASGQTMACSNVTSDQSEGYVKTPGHSPPVLYSATKVAGDLMTVRTFSDQARQHQIAVLVYNRVP